MPSEAVGCLFEHEERVRTDTIEPHSVGRFFGLHELLERFHVGHIHDQPDTVGLRRIGEELARDAHGPKGLLPLGRLKPVADVVDFVKDNDRWHVNEPPRSGPEARGCLRPQLQGSQSEAGSAVKVWVPDLDRPTLTPACMTHDRESEQLSVLPLAG